MHKIQAFLNLFFELCFVCMICFLFVLAGVPAWISFGVGVGIYALATWVTWLIMKKFFPWAAKNM